jgi:pimeloyl-ACP methyl ester carboxylesterase
MRLAFMARRAGIGIIGRLAPRATARRLLDAYMRPPQIPAPAREIEALSGVERFTIPWRDVELVAWRWGDGPTVLLAHGWAGRAGQMAAFGPALAAAGFRAVAIDAPAHGQSGGRDLTIADYAEAIGHVASSLGGVVAVIAHSYGAPSTAVAIALGKLSTGKLVFIGAPITQARYVAKFERVWRLPGPVKRHWRTLVEQRLGFAVEGTDLTRIAGDMKTPLLIAHCQDDYDVPLDDAQRLVATWPGARLFETKGLGHRRILRDPAVVELAVDFVSGRGN